MKASLPGEQVLPRALVPLGHAFEQLECVRMPVKLGQNVRAIEIDERPHGVVARLCQYVARSVIMLKRFSITVEPVVDGSDVCFKLSEASRIITERAAGRASRLERFAVQARLGERVNLLGLNE